ncbi:Hexokinase-2 [Thelohanellus kitauei]|uniref:Phosphotransferase n=1 Tax=Thelohanellus kitauei TaxID=669202 RepID=A0A0C2M539_THEKT|nr:Hexokinase-2 [Thelohanellus kitauei]
MEDILNEFRLKFDKLFVIRNLIHEAFQHGLDSDGSNYLYHPIKMLNTHLMVVPNGRECGRYVALDLGGTNLRVLAISVKNRTVSISPEKFEVPHDIQTGTGIQLFDYLADRIDEAFVTLGFKDVDVEVMGFTFSFPCLQNAINHGELIRWTKGYSATGVEKEDVVAMLRNACNKKGLKIHDFVLINDTTGTLLCGAFEFEKCTIGLINGTGTNACYLEKVSNVKKIKGQSDHDLVIINTEWGSFGENHELDPYLNRFDFLVDKYSINKGMQIFEKTISGMYLGEIVRYVIIEASDKGIIFRGGIPDDMEKKNSFPTTLMSDVYSEAVFTQKFTEIFNYALDEEEYKTILRVCDVVVYRAAQLCAAGLWALITRINVKDSIIAADGSIFNKHPRFKEYVNHNLELMLPNDFEIKIEMVDDGSGKGAALAACVVYESLKRNQNKQIDSSGSSNGRQETISDHEEI